ncbi:aspartyl-phosphate phosphatase Spo0E family protein [Bacillus sp. DX1.1]|uniref:aspartyl-phosphate phosphatase Spo0E family protein n=1 Tax=unclassified Bacillus (in: firmicutes) TaxID=185979 RepID=UPI00256FFB9A|nr:MULTISPECIES: aspartyl-phosphate phosphatase Spo0E family protein [unclassified Bacillus (in: firmicutes)]MDM5154291.1 aspartyl-phosphate phosphatase Spo0E family protein [Bacillus sp. DX1.1]WJE84031.1 aspartyl-phosphate phosphatase Spo0E family protein [Bacillus sp. DX3.1]
MIYNFLSNIMRWRSLCIDMEMRKLHNIIEEKKKELIQLVTSYGLDHEKVIDFSQDLDCLIYRMMEQKKNPFIVRILKQESTNIS